MLADINGNLADLRSEAMASQRFCLRWNNHQSNLLSVFDQLLHDESFVDVTLAVEGQLLRAHKMVLSACSPYFQALFVGHPDKHPIVILKDVPYVDMRSLLDFMYRGEVSVDQDRLTAFLRVAESLRIKGLTEVNEDKCDLPSITSSLLGGSQNAVAPPPPSLHRINQIGPHHVAQKRFHHMSSHPLLGSALTAPKRKRGRPRKLSGSSDTPIGEVSGQDLQSCSGADLVQGSPEMMEMKMGLDFQSEVSGNSNVRSAGASSSNNAGANSATANNSAASSGSSSARRDEPTENGTDTPEPPVTRVKREPEPTPSTSAQASDETFARPHSRQGNESFKQEFSSSKTDNGNETWKEKTRGLNTGASPAAMDVSSPNSSSSSSPANARASTSSSTSTTNATSATTNAGATPTTTSATGGTSTRSSSASPASRNTGGSSANTTSNVGVMSAPSGRQAPKRRMRRRATSQSQDPAEQLTEMSVRGLNLFRYASISEGVYQCTECAKLDIQKTFKNKYSFQRHAFLYHEGHQRKVFPCPVCAKEFSRPDKMKNHMKTVHDCFMPKDCVMPFSFFLPDQLPPQLPSDITFEICSSSSPSSPAAPASSVSSATHGGDDEGTGGTDAFIKTERIVSGVHFLTDRTEEDRTDLLLPKSEAGENEPEVRKQLLEYLIQNDGSVVCKWCGEVLPSRTRWYRHKYKLHVSTQVAQPAPLFKCHSCNTYFKSRKGYIGHLSSRHSDNENDENREEPSNKKTRKTSIDIGKGPDWEQQREKEEKLVADIIDRVKRECEAQGEAMTRRGYSRRSTIMNS